MNAKVYKSTGSWYQVKDEAGKFWNARTKGVMKLDDINKVKSKQKPIIVAGSFLILATIFYLVGWTAMGSISLVASVTMVNTTINVPN